MYPLTPQVHSNSNTYRLSLQRPIRVIIWPHNWQPSNARVYRGSLLLKAVLDDLKISEYLTGVKDLGLIGRLVTSPLWLVLKDKSVHILNMNVYYSQLTITSQLMWHRIWEITCLVLFFHLGRRRRCNLMWSPNRYCNRHSLMLLWRVHPHSTIRRWLPPPLYNEEVIATPTLQSGGDCHPQSTTRRWLPPPLYNQEVIATATLQWGGDWWRHHCHSQGHNRVDHRQVLHKPGLLLLPL